MSKPKVTHVTMKDAKGRVIYKRTPKSITMRGAAAQDFIKQFNAEQKKRDGKDN